MYAPPEPLAFHFWKPHARDPIDNLVAVFEGYVGGERRWAHECRSIENAQHTVAMMDAAVAQGTATWLDSRFADEWRPDTPLRLMASLLE